MRQHLACASCRLLVASLLHSLFFLEKCGVKNGYSHSRQNNMFLMVKLSKPWDFWGIPQLKPLIWFRIPYLFCWRKLTNFGASEGSSMDHATYLAVNIIPIWRSKIDRPKWSKWMVQHDQQLALESWRHDPQTIKHWPIYLKTTNSLRNDCLSESIYFFVAPVPISTAWSGPSNLNLGDGAWSLVPTWMAHAMVRAYEYGYLMDFKGAFMDV